MIKDFRKTENLKKIKNGQFSFFDILQLPYTVISNSEKLTMVNIYPYLLISVNFVSIPKNMYLNRRLSNLASSLISGTFTLESRKLEGKLHQSPCRQNGELFWGVGTSKVTCRFRI